MLMEMLQINQTLLVNQTSNNFKQGNSESKYLQSIFLYRKIYNHAGFNVCLFLRL